MDNLAIVVNTNSNYRDVWPMFFGEFKIYFPNIKIYTFVNQGDYEDNIENRIYYDDSICFRDQYLSCIKQVPEKYVINMNEDYILYNPVDIDKIKEYINVLETTNYSFVRLLKGQDIHNVKYSDDLYIIPFWADHLYSQVPTIWKTRTLQEIHEKGPPLHMGLKGKGVGQSFEYESIKVCMNMGLEGLYSHCGENKRGQAHYDCKVFNCIVSALVCGCWNLREYTPELEPLIKKYNIDTSIRGIF